MSKRFLLVILLLCLGLGSSTIFAQDITTKGSIEGTVTDAAGGVIPGATITVTGPTGDVTVKTNDAGVFTVPNLTPDTYSIKAEQPNFKTAAVANVQVFIGKAATLKLQLEPGNVSEVVNVSATSAVDLQSTAAASNLNDQLYSNIPVARSVSSLFYLAPGTTDGLGGGRDNPSISGGSALDNLYIANGVNITNSAFGGIGTFSRSFGALGTGINTSFIKEVQVKTGGFEPEYGQSTGGIVNIITQSGGNDFHGALYGYARPRFFEATRRQRDDFSINKVGKILHEENYDVGADFSGPLPIPHFGEGGRAYSSGRDKLFFFGSFNPTIRREIVSGAQRNAADIANNRGSDSGLFRLLGETARRTRTLNYAFKVDYNLNEKNQLNFSIFGDPSATNTAPFNALNIDNTTDESRLSYGTRNSAIRYNGAFGGANPLTVIASFSQGKNRFDESGFANFNSISDRTQTATRGNFIAIGRGFFEPTRGTTYRTTIDVSKQASLLGTHTFKVGYTYQRGSYAGTRDRSGPKFVVPATNADGTLAVNPLAVGQPLNATFRLRLQSASCTLCPLLAIPGNTTNIGFGPGVARVSLQQDRGEFGNPNFDTFSKYHAAYVQDTYRINRFVTALLGLRMEQERLVGSPGTGGRRNAYSLTDNYAPRLGVTVDPFGRGKTKVYYNYGRFFQFIPLDLAERSLSSEQDFIGGRFAPEFTVDAAGNRRAVVNSFGTVNPVVTSASLLSGARGGIAGAPQVSISDQESFLPGTKLGFLDEHSVGVEQQLPGKFVVSVRYIDRKLKRIVEDGATLSPEAALAGIGQVYFLGNIGPRTDAGINLVPFQFATGAAMPAGCTSGFSTDITDLNGNNTGRSVCFGQRGIDANGTSINTPDGNPDGFPAPTHRYRAVEIEFNKRFSNGYQLLTNYRFASLRGNFEGNLRNDNGQTDPAISSLFDFTAGDFNLLGDQFASGPLNTDRKFVSNIYGSYAFSKERKGFGGRFLNGFNIGAGLNLQSGLPISELLTHPVYQNAGEIPVGGRGKLGRTPFYGRLDLHGDYPYQLSEKVRISFIGDLFNVTNSRKIQRTNEFRQLTPGIDNPDFGQPREFRTPLNLRLGMRLEF